ncbi:MAG: MarR family winged helix-turn-helix transcriptional regulator [Pseudomonadota bacterium]
MASPERETAATPQEKHDGAPHSKLSLRLWLRMLSCVMVIEKQVRRQLIDQFGTTLPRFDLMAALERRPDGMVMSELSKSLMVSSGNVTSVVDRLIEDGFVSRTTAQNDRRSIIVKLTAKGRREFNRMANAHEEWFDKLFSDMSDYEIERLLVRLGDLRSSVDKRLPEIDAMDPGA